MQEMKRLRCAFRSDQRPSVFGCLAIALLVIGAPLAQAQDPAAAPPPKECEVVVLNFENKGLAENEAHVAELLTNTFAAEVSKSAGCKVITQSDIKSMTDFDAQRAMCGSAESCMAEIGNALGVDIVIGGAVGRLGDAYVLQVMKRNVSKGVVEARVDDTITGGAGALQPAARNAARKIYGLASNAAGATTTKTEPAATTETSSSGSEAESSGGGTGLLFAGIGVAGAGALLLAAGVGAAVAIDFLVLGDKAVPGSDKDTAAIAGIGALAGGVVVGAIGLAVGGTLAGLGAMGE